MTCRRCGGRGYLESALMRDADPDGKGTLQQCCDISKYSAEVARRMNSESDEQAARRLLGHGNPGVVLEFKRREKNETP